jgi:peptidoglycan hydrolase CwlO-like protein
MNYEEIKQQRIETLQQEISRGKEKIEGRGWDIKRSKEGIEVCYNEIKEEQVRIKFNEDLISFLKGESK